LATHSKTGYGDKILTAEILPEGIPPVKRIGAYLREIPYDFGACSEFIRCRQTAAIVSEITGRGFVPDARLNEQYQESFDAVRDRVRAFVIEMQQSPHQHIWVCTHGIVIAALKHLILTGSFAQKDELDYILPGEILVIHAGESQVIRLNGD